ncbi:reverse transcriptase domain-containing protein [Tanacetum coccineum]
MSAMANTTPIVATVTKPATKEKTPKDADATPRIRRDKRKEVHARLDFGESPKKRRIREGSQNSSARTLSARYRNPSERLKVRDRLRYNDRHVLDRLGHRRQSAFDRLSDTYSPSTTKSGPDMANSKDRSHSRSRPHRRDSSNRDRPRSRDCSRGVEESYDNTRSSYGTGTKHGYHSRDRGRSHYVKIGRESESPLSRVSESGTSGGGHWKSKSKRHKSTDEDDLAVPCICEEVDPFTPRIRNFKRAARVWFDELPPESIDGYKDLKAAFLAYFMQQKKYVKDPVEIHNIKQKDGETIKEFMERFKVETGYMKGAPECMRISGFMHGVNNPKLTKRLNEHVPKTMEEMMITTTAFIRGEAAVAGKKKGHASWRAQDQSKRHASERRSDLRGQPREGRGSSRFTPLTRTPKEILAAEAGKFKPPPPMVTPMEKRSSNKFCDFHNDKGHSTDECMQSKKQIEELVRAGKLSHLVKEIKQGRDQPNVGKKEVPTKDKSMAIYMIQPWHRMTRQKVTQSFKRVSKITFPSLITSSGTEGPLVIEAEIGGHMIHRMYVDGGSSTEDNFRLLVTIGDAVHSTKAWMNFMIVRSLSPYNGIIRRPGIREIQAVPSKAHGMLKFPVDRGIVTIHRTILIPAKCATVITSSKEIPKEAGVHHENFKVALHLNFPDQEVAIGATLFAKRQTKLCSLLKENLDIFAWHPSDMTGVPRSIAEHRLNIREGYSPVRQKKRGQAPKRAKAIQTELADVRGFHGLKQGLSAGLLPLPEIDWKVESLCGYPFKCFLDAYKGYHKIQMAESDEEKTAFHTSHGVYCYTKMPFGLKNAGATYQRLVDKDFDSQVGRNIEVYVDDLVIKSNTEAEMLRDINETFRTLRKINMKLNPKKCTFGKVEGMFLGYMISPEGIKLCPDKTEVVLQLPSPWTIKEILADFLVEKSDESPPDTSVVETPQESWILFTDRSSCVDGFGVGLILIIPEGTEFTYALRFQFTASNNEAEYKALIVGLWIAAQMGVRNVHKVKSLVSGFTNFSISQVPRSKNKKADALSKIASTSFAHLSKQVLVKILKEKSIQEKEVTTVVEEDGLTWMTPIIEYLKERTLPKDKKEASKLRIKARQYELWEGVLYRRSFINPWLRKGQIFDSRYGLFHKVDRGESRVDNHWQSGEEVRMGQHSVPLRSPKRNSFGQRKTFQWQPVQGLV